MLTLLCPSCDCYYWLSRWKDLESLRSQASGHDNKLFSWVELIEVGRQTVNDGSTLPWAGVLEKMRGKKASRTWAVVSLYSGMYGFPCFIFFYCLPFGCWPEPKSGLSDTLASLTLSLSTLFPWPYHVTVSCYVSDLCAFTQMAELISFSLLLDS